MLASRLALIFAFSFNCMLPSCLIGSLLLGMLLVLIEGFLQACF